MYESIEKSKTQHVALKSTQRQSAQNNMIMDNRPGTALQESVQLIADNYNASKIFPIQRQDHKSIYTASSARGAQKISSGLTMQRLQIGGDEIDGLIADFDSDDLDISRQAISDLADARNNDSLRALRGVLYGKKGANDIALVKYIDKLLKDGVTVPDELPMGSWEKFWMNFGDQPDVDEDVQTGLNMWVVGDKDRGVNWAMVGKHLRGLLTDDDYSLIGTMHFLKAEEEEDNAGVLIQKGKDTLDGVRGDIRGALDDLPDFTGKSYRISGVQNNGVFETKIKKNDLIKDTTFWSTAAVRGAGAAAESWGESGSEGKPQAYFIIDGATGKYIARYSEIEGEREVLFKDRTVFKVNRIINKANTFFVYIREVGNVPVHATVKNPYTGDAY